MAEATPIKLANTIEPVNVGAKTLDARCYVKTKADAEDLHVKLRYEGMKVYVEDEHKEYYYKYRTGDKGANISTDSLVEYFVDSEFPSVCIFNSIEERDAFPIERRTVGMEANVWVGNSLVKYYLMGGTDNSKWVEYVSPGSVWGIIE